MNAFIISPPNLNNQDVKNISAFIDKNNLQSFWPVRDGSRSLTIRKAYQIMKQADVVYVYWGNGDVPMAEINMLITLRKPTLAIFPDAI